MVGMKVTLVIDTTSTFCMDLHHKSHMTVDNLAPANTFLTCLSRFSFQLYTLQHFQN